MRHLILLVLLSFVGCKQTLPTEDHTVTVIYIPAAPVMGTTVDGSFEVMEPMEAGPPIKTWVGEPVCQQGDPLCELLP